MAETICIYHANCCDGFAAAWAVRRALGPYVKFVPAQYKSDPPTVAGADVVIVDFSYKRPVLEQMALSARSILILDHHKTAQSDLTGLPKPAGGQWDAHLSAAGNPVALFDMNRSGAQMAWDFFFPEEDRPLLIDVVADRDLWRWQIASSRELNAVISSHAFEFTDWGTLARKLQSRSGVELMTAEGSAILRAHDKLVDQVIASSKREMRIGGYVVPVASAPYALASDVAGRMAEGHPFAATYVDGPEGRTFSLRARAGERAVDVQDIAQSYGGGGHTSAAGFVMPLGWEGDPTLVMPDNRAVVKCPSCGGDAKYDTWERVEGGSVNRYESTDCTVCEYSDHPAFDG